MAFGVWVQAIDDRTGAANIEKYASFQEYDDLYAEGFSKSFCDGQTSPTAPRYADDRMGMLWVPDEETAQFIQQILREDIADRVATEGLKLTGRPNWATWMPKEITRETINVAIEKVEDYDDYNKVSGEWYHGSDIGFGGDQQGRQYGATYITDRIDVAVDYGQPYVLKINPNASSLDLSKWDDTKEFLDKLREISPEHYLLEHGYAEIHPDLIDNISDLATAISDDWIAVRSELDDVLGEMDFNLGGGLFDFAEISDIIRDMGRTYVLDAQGNGIIYDFNIVDKVTRIVLTE